MKKMAVFLFCLGLNAFFSCVYAQNNDPAIGVPSQQELLNLNRDILRMKQHNQELLLALQALNDEPTPKNINENDLTQLRVELEQVQITLSTQFDQMAIVEKNIEENQKRASFLSSQLQKLSNPLITGTDADALLQNKTQTQHFIDRNQQQLTLLQKRKQMLEQTIFLTENRKTLLENRYQLFNESYLEKSNNHPPAPVENKRDKLVELEKMRTELMASLSETSSSRERRLDKNIEISLLNKQIFYTETENELLMMETRLQELQYADLTTLSLERINRIRNEMDLGRQRLEILKNQLDSQQKLINEQYSLYLRQRSDSPKSIAAREKNLSQQFHEISSLLENNLINLNMNSQVANEQYNILAKNYLKAQYHPLLNLGKLPQLGGQIFKANSAFIGQYAVALQTLYHGLLRLSSNLWITLTMIGVMLVGITTMASLFLNRLIRRYSQQKLLSFSSRLLYFISEMLKNNLPYLTFLLLMFGAIRITNIAAPASGLLMLIPAMILFNTIPYYAAHNLIKTELIAAPARRRIMRPTMILAVVGSSLFALVLMAQWILEQEALIDVYRWIFAFYNLLVALPLWHAVRRSLFYMTEFYGDHFTYRILRPVIYAIILSIFIFGLIGFLGYLNLAWTLAHYLLIFFVYALLWVALLALLKDTSLRAKHYAVRNTSNGVFWAQDVINPIHNLCRYGSLALFSYLLLRQFDWDSNTPIIREMLILLKKPITGGENGQFTLFNILLLAIIVYTIYRIGGWIKSFSYRWIFANIQDLGIRNSLSVFSQYAAVTLGFFLALRVVGLDLTTFTVFAGALGVGIGFGMQNIAHNFISGILLLIERPLRNGDIITVGNYVGTVERIGMRSLTISTFDNESVILPNSDFVTSAFMNWSHTDEIVRTVFYLDINYRHNPKIVEELFNDALKKLVTEDIIIDMPAPDFLYGAFAYQYSERGITYRIQYYINMNHQHILISRNRVIQQIWQTCRENGLEIAYPKQDVYFPENPDQLAHQIRTLPAGEISKLPPV